LTLDTYIAKLLYDHNCVIVPGFGAFIANYQASQINAAQNRIYPPGKQLAFNPSLKNNDGLLAHHLAKEEFISFDQANENIAAQLSLWTEKLQKGERIRINKIGELVLNESQKLIFTPYQSVNFLKESFGYAEIALQEISRKRIMLDVDSLKKYQQEKKKERIGGRSNVRNRRIVYMSVTAYLPILIGLWFLFLLKEPFTGQESGFKVFNDNKVETIEQIPQPAVEATEETEAVAIENMQAEVVENEEEKPELIPERVQGPFYYIIGGSFRDESNAENFRDELLNRQYPRSRVLDGENGYYRVSYDRFIHSNEALNYLQIINQNENPAAWILKH
jgi:hypothetical protein